MPRYVHFEHYVDDAQKTIDFYQKVFDWKLEKFGDMPYWLVTSGPEGEPGIDGGISQSEPPNGQRVVNTIGVEDIDATVERAKEAGATVVAEKMPIVGMGWVAYLVDPSGIVFGLFSMDEHAGM